MSWNPAHLQLHSPTTVHKHFRRHVELKVRRLIQDIRETTETKSRGHLQERTHHSCHPLTPPLLLASCGNRNPNIVPTFLQPNTVRSSRAAIFDDDFGQQQQQSKPTHSNRTKSSRRNQDEDSQEGEDSEDGEDQQSKSILERLYGKLQGAIEIEGTATLSTHHWQRVNESYCPTTFQLKEMNIAYSQRLISARIYFRHGDGDSNLKTCFE